MDTLALDILLGRLLDANWRWLIQVAGDDCICTLVRGDSGMAGMGSGPTLSEALLAAFRAACRRSEQSDL